MFSKKVLIYCIIGLCSILILGAVTICLGKPSSGKDWTKIKSYSINLDLNKQPEKVEIFAQVEVDKMGVILWDDSQWWKVSVFKGEKEEILLEQFIVLGNLNVSIGKEGKENNPIIVIIKDTNDTLEIFKFKKSRNTYLQQRILEIQKDVYSAIPNFYDMVEGE